MADNERDIWISISGRPITPSLHRHRDDRAVYRGLIRDVTEEVERESRRLIEQQMFALGQLAGSVAHEINNLIHPIINLTKRLRLRTSQTADPESTRMMDLIDISSRQAATVVSELLQSTRGERWKDVNRPISTAVEHGVDAIRPALPSSMRIDTVIAECDAVTVKVGDILQIVGNLLSNAVHAMNGAGTITVTLTGLEDGARLTIADDGAGMEESVRRRAMQPFFSTKVDGRGTGVGLYVVQRIVRDYGGWITLESSPGHGTTVTIFFPIRKDEHGNPEGIAQGARGG
jgi:signal transduction histidine kinase